jgi:hypothetical protein
MIACYHHHRYHTGAYSEECAFSKPNERDALYERLEPTSAEKTASAALSALRIAESHENSRSNSHAGSHAGSHGGSRASSRPGTADRHRLGSPGSRPGTSSLLGGLGANKNQKTVLEVERREKMDLVKDSRPRYVNPELLPSVRAVSLVQQMSTDEAKRQAEILRKRQGLGSDHGIAAAREQMEEAIGRATGSADPDNGDPDKSAARKKQDAEKQLAMRKLFLQKEVPKYGEGRITSTHNTRGKIEEPWVTTKGRYATVEGDRTA